jgi:hypothetical protein
MLRKAWGLLWSWLRCAGVHDDHRVVVRWYHRPELPSVFMKCFRCGRTSDGRFEP